MKKLKYIKLYEQYKMNEEIFGLFGKKTEPKKAQTEVEMDQRDKIGTELIKVLFPNGISLNPRVLYHCFIDFDSGKFPYTTFENIVQLLQELNEQSSSIDLRLKNLSAKINNIDVSPVQRGPLEAAVKKSGNATFANYIEVYGDRNFQEYLISIDFSKGKALNDTTLFVPGDGNPFYICFNFDEFIKGEKEIFSLHIKRISQLLSYFNENDFKTMMDNFENLKKLSFDKFGTKDFENTITHFTNLINKLTEIQNINNQPISEILNDIQKFLESKGMTKPFDEKFDKLLK